MPSTFKTFGPFELPAQPDGDRSFKHIWNEHRLLRYGIGIYIVAEKRGSVFFPWYVGKSDRSFGSRLNSHSIFKSLPQELSAESIFIFLIARVTSHRQQIIRSKTKYVDQSGDEAKRELKKLKAIARLEYELIGSCRIVNDGLLNFQLKKFQEGLRVPGYVGGSKDDMLDESDLALQKMLESPARRK